MVERCEDVLILVDDHTRTTSVRKILPGRRDGSSGPVRDNPLLQLDNVVLSDHTAWYSEESVAELQTKASLKVAHVFRGEMPKHWLNCWTT